jgi:hypothetical protein
MQDLTLRCERKIKLLKLLIISLTFIALLAGCDSKLDPSKLEEAKREEIKREEAEQEVANQEWRLTSRNSIVTRYVDISSLKKEGELVKMTTYAVYNKPFATSTLPKEHWSLMMTTLINCHQRSWVAIKFTTFDKEGNVVESGGGASTSLYSVPNWDYGLQNICDHVLNGSSLNIIPVENDMNENYRDR